MHAPIPTDLEALVEQALERRWRQTRRRLAVIGGVASVALATFLSAPALAQMMCSPMLPSGLVTFCSDTPARANDVNANFLQVVNWLTQKVGTQGSANVNMTGNLTVTGTNTTL